MRLALVTAAALLACQGCIGEISGGFTMTDGGDADSGAAGTNGLAGARGSAGNAASGGGPGSGGAPGSGGRGGSAGTSVAAGGIGGISAAGGAGGAGGISGAGGAGGAKPCGLDSASCTSCLGPICPDAIQACGTSTSCLDALTLLAGCICPAAPNGKTGDQCLIDLTARSTVAAPLAKCMQTATTCRSLCGL